MDRLGKALQKARNMRDQIHTPPPPANYAPQIKSTAPSYPLSQSLLLQNRIVAHLENKKEADVFRLLRTQVLQKMKKEGLQSLAMTSPAHGDGKSTMALNLAISIARDVKQTALLVDLDLRKPSLSSYLGITPIKGLNDYFARKASLEEILIRLPFPRLALLPAGDSLTESSEIIGSPTMAALAKELKARYPDRYIIYDMPPLLTQDDTLAFLPQTDATLLVCRENITRQEDITRSLALLSDTKLLGTVLNDTVYSRSQ
ncbi:MAG: CpsD/CapB family tyrosine-protein kinase [Bdellovibrionales bacterium]